MMRSRTRISVGVVVLACLIILGCPPVGQGALTVTLEPAAARAAGAQWRIDGGAWQESGATLFGLAVGVHTVGFRAIDNWSDPDDTIVTIAAAQTATLTGTYVSDPATEGEGEGEGEAAAVVINEFLAANDTILADEDGDYSDWIELYNTGAEPIDLAGWALTDDPDEPDRWILPGVTLDGYDYLVVFASGKDLAPTDGAELHANFRLSAAGEYLALYDAQSPPRVASEFAPDFPLQLPDVSYGLHDAPGYWYLDPPTPGAANTTGTPSR